MIIDDECDVFMCMIFDYVVGCVLVIVMMLYYSM